MVAQIPTISPLPLSKGPPEFPGLIAASVWIIPLITVLASVRTGRPRPDMLPMVIVRS
jgi:hypothetical protein